METEEGCVTVSRPFTADILVPFYSKCSNTNQELVAFEEYLKRDNCDLNWCHKIIKCHKLLLGVLHTYSAHPITLHLLMHNVINVATFKQLSCLTKHTNNGNC